MRATLWSMRTWLRLSLLLALLLVAGCGSDEKAVPGDAQSPQDVLHQLRPISTAQVTAVARASFDNAPPEVGNPLELRFEGPLRNNGPDKLPSLDWKISFTGFNDQFSSRVVSTGSDVFVRLGGADFALGEAAVARMVDQARQAQVAGRTGFAAIGVDPLKVVRDLEEKGTGDVAGVKVTRYTGTVDRQQLFDQLERFFRGIPNPGGAPTVITPKQRAELTSMFSAPQFELDVAADRTVRRIVITDRFRTLVANRKAAGGITGGKLSYEVTYAPLKSMPQINPPARSEPLANFVTALQQELLQK
jgi:hypothetical protein